MIRYLVTGGAGFIGSHLAVRLLRDGHFVRVLDNLSTGRLPNLEVVRAASGGERFEWLEGDVRSLEDCRRSCRQIDYVIHEAALASVQRSIRDPSETTAVNVGGTVHVLTAARENGVRRVVIASSSSVYGDTPTLPKREDMTPRPLSPYAVAKLACEEFARVFACTLGVPTVSLRYFNVFGPRQDPASEYAAVVPRFIAGLLTGGRPVVYGDGGQTRDFTYVDNVVQASLNACAHGEGRGEVFNIACGERYSLTSLLEALGRIVGRASDPEYADPRPGDVRDSIADIARAREVLGYVPRVTFEEGLMRTVEYFRSGVDASTGRCSEAT